jgi:hypothetical protein
MMQMRMGVGLSSIEAPGAAAEVGGGGDSPYDAIPSIAAAYGMRRLLTTYTGSLLRLRRSSDNAEQDFGYVTNGDLDVAAIATFVGGGSGYVVTWYDQSGNGRNATQSTAASQPLYVASGQNSRPVVRGDGTQFLRTATFTAIPQPASALVLGKRTAIDRNYARLIGGGTDTGFLTILFDTAANTTTVYITSAVGVGIAATVTDVYAPTIYAVLASGAASALRENGVQVATGDMGAYTMTQIGIFADATVAVGKADIAEYVLASAAWATGSFEAAETAANQYWGVY